MIFRKTESGQTIVIVTVSMFVLVAMAALIIDGGYAYLNRRNAQTAADAAALAGAYERCLNKGTEEEIGTVIEQYAETENNAVVEEWVSANENNDVEVIVSVAGRSFFAGVFGRDETVVQARATAGCFSPGAGTGILPVAWACKHPGGSTAWDSGDCEYLALDWKTELKPIIDSGYDFSQIGNMLPEMYIIMDGDSLPEGLEGTCISEGGQLQCDLDGDGMDDFQGNGDISWLDLDGGGGGVKEEWITEGFDGTLKSHQWLTSQTGQLGFLFNSQGALIEKVGSIVTLPVFNQHCVGQPVNEDGTVVYDQNCINLAHQLVDPPVPPDKETSVGPYSGSSTYYHIAGFGLFYISCVHGPGTSDCPGHYAMVNAVPPIIADNVSTVEGYFVTGYPPSHVGVGSGGVDLGVYVISLTE